MMVSGDAVMRVIIRWIHNRRCVLSVPVHDPRSQPAPVQLPVRAGTALTRRYRLQPLRSLRHSPLDYWTDESVDIAIAAAAVSGGGLHRPAVPE